VNLTKLAPRVLSPVLPHMSEGTVNAENMSSLAVISAVACATALAVKLQKNLNDRSGT
jgi:hypothetical protein